VSVGGDALQMGCAGGDALQSIFFIKVLESENIIYF
jgi:hypothetical protein